MAAEHEREGPVVTYRRAVVAPLDDLVEAWRRVRDRYWLFVGICAAGMLLGSMVPMAILLGPMMCGIYGCFRDRWKDRPVRFEGLFDGFKPPMLLQSILATLVLVGLAFVVAYEKVFGVADV